MSKVAIHPAGIADLPALRRLISAFHQAEDLSDPPNLDEAITALLGAPHRGSIWLAFLNGEPVGYIVAVHGFSLASGGDALTIDQLYVEDAARGQGIGRLLVAAAEVHGELHGCRTLLLEIGNGNRRAQLFYANSGFTPRLRRVWERPIRRQTATVLPVA